MTPKVSHGKEVFLNSRRLAGGIECDLTNERGEILELPTRYFADMSATQSRTVWSFAPDATCDPSAEIATHVTSPVCPEKRMSTLNESTLHSRTVWSALPVKR